MADPATISADNKVISSINNNNTKEHTTTAKETQHPSSQSPTPTPKNDDNDNSPIPIPPSTKASIDETKIEQAISFLKNHEIKDVTSEEKRRYLETNVGLSSDEINLALDRAARRVGIANSNEQPNHQRGDYRGRVQSYDQSRLPNNYHRQHYRNNEPPPHSHNMLHSNEREDASNSLIPAVGGFSLGVFCLAAMRWLNGGDFVLFPRPTSSSVSSMGETTTTNYVAAIKSSEEEKDHLVNNSNGGDTDESDSQGQEFQDEDEDDGIIEENDEYNINDEENDADIHMILNGTTTNASRYHPNDPNNSQNQATQSPSYDELVIEIRALTSSIHSYRDVQERANRAAHAHVGKGMTDDAMEFLRHKKNESDTTTAHQLNGEVGKVTSLNENVLSLLTNVKDDLMLIKQSIVREGDKGGMTSKEDTGVKVHESEVGDKNELECDDTTANNDEPGVTSKEDTGVKVHESEVGDKNELECDDTTTNNNNDEPDVTSKEDTGVKVLESEGGNKNELGCDATTTDNDEPADTEEKHVEDPSKRIDMAIEKIEQMLAIVEKAEKATDKEDFVSSSTSDNLLPVVKEESEAVSPAPVESPTTPSKNIDENEAQSPEESSPQSDNSETDQKTSKEDAKQQSLENALQMLSNNNTVDDLKVGAQMLYLYCLNISKNPTVPRYRKIYTNNNTFRKKVGILIGAKEFLVAVGFVERTNFYEWSQSSDEGASMCTKNMLDFALVALELLKNGSVNDENSTKVSNVVPEEGKDAGI